MHAETVSSHLCCRPPPVCRTGSQLEQPALPQNVACGRIWPAHDTWSVGALVSPYLMMLLLAADHGLWAHQAASFDSYTASPEYPMRVSERAAGDNQFKVGVAGQ